MFRIPGSRPRIAVAVLVALATTGLALAQQAAQVAGTLDGHTDPVYAIAWSPDGKTLITGGFDNTVRLWDAATRTVNISSRGASTSPPRSGPSRARGC